MLLELLVDAADSSEDGVALLVRRTPWYWYVIGFGGQLVFASRFWVQWIASERARKSVVPISFWWLSIAGGMLCLCYAIYRMDPVFIMGQLTGSVIYARNLMLIQQTRRGEAAGGGGSSSEKVGDKAGQVKAGEVKAGEVKAGEVSGR